MAAVEKTVSAAEPALAPARAFADFAAGLRFEDLPSGAIEHAKLLILDALGVGLASNAYSFAEAAMAGARALGEGGRSSVIGRADKLPVRDAAMVNGILIHGLDFDDTHLKSIVHPTAACLPAILALGEQLGSDGRSVLAAYAAGMETAIRLGLAVNGGFHHVGFHATGVLAHFSSAVAASRLLGLTAAETVAAQGIAASTASGVQVFLEEGAWTKRFHPGWAAVAGITAANLAKAGFRGPSRPYEGRFGLMETHLQEAAAKVDYAAATGGLGETWELAETAIKPYPVCHFIHGCADAAIEIHKELGGEEIASVEALLAADTMPIVAEPAAAKQEARTEYEAKFSAQFVVAACLLNGRFGLPELQPEALADPAVHAIARKVACKIDPDTAFPRYFSGGVTVHTAGGRRLHRHIEINSGAGPRALDLDGVTEKFLASASLTVDEARALRIRECVLSLEKTGARPLMAALSG